MYTVFFVLLLKRMDVTIEINQIIEFEINLIIAVSFLGIILWFEHFTEIILFDCLWEGLVG